MNEEKVKYFKIIISKFWKLFNECIKNDFGSDAMWSKAVTDSDNIRELYPCEFSDRMEYIILNEMTKIQKGKEEPDIKIYYNGFLDIGNALKEANNWDSFNVYLHNRYTKYNGMRFAENMFDLIQEEVAKYITEQGENN